MSKNYQESLDYLYSLQFFGIKLGLDNVRSLLARVNNPQQQLRIIHIAGTNGKGSTSAAITSILHAAGFSTGLYTSPHLHHFSERIRINTKQVSEVEIVSLVEEIRPHAEQLKATFFEVTTVMALLAFARHKVDWVVLETGMGGRLDATNTVMPELTVLTPIAFDHAGFLGNSLAAIAAEKAGIIKPGIPVVCAEQKSEATEVIRQTCARLDSSLVQSGVDFHVSVDCVMERFSVTGKGGSLGPYGSSLAGLHQCQNQGLALAAIMELKQRGLVVSEAAVAAGLTQLRWPGRLEWLADRVLIDGAHNLAGIDALVQYLERMNLSDLHLIFGCKEDKQASDMLVRLLPYAACVYATKPPDVDAVDPGVMVAVARQHGVVATGFSTARSALAAARQARNEQATIVVAGSLFLIADLRAALVENPNVLDIIAL